MSKAKLAKELTSELNKKLKMNQMKLVLNIARGHIQNESVLVIENKPRKMQLKPKYPLNKRDYEF